MSTTTTLNHHIQGQSLSEIYEAERRKRLDGQERTYTALRDSDFAHLTADQNVQNGEQPAPSVAVQSGDHVKVLVLGAGHCGLIFSSRLVQAGFDPRDILHVDNAGGFGGTWYWNRYPGLMCDVEGYIYLPLLEETGLVPKHKYSYGQEIRHNAELIAKKHRLRALFKTTVSSFEWDDEKSMWRAEAVRHFADGKLENLKLTSEFVYVAGGFLSDPKIPSLTGLDKFIGAGGKVFHTARWDYNVTGGSQEEPRLTKLADKTVAVIGTGASSVQVVPEVAKYAKELLVFQRTPSYIGERNQAETHESLWKGVANGEGWQKRRQDNFNSFINNRPDKEDLIRDGWTELVASAAFHGGRGKYDIVTPQTIQEHIKYFFDLDAPRASKLRDRVASEVQDEKTAESLKAWYPGWCKRPVFNDDYMQAFNRENVDLINTEGQGIQEFSPRGILANGKEYPVDIIVMGTGFDTGAQLGPTERAHVSVKGRGGQDFQQKWDSTDFGTLHGVMSNGFPNMFFSSGIHQSFSWNLTSQFEATAKHVAFIMSKAVAEASKSGHRVVVEAPTGMEKDWAKIIAERSMWFSTVTICTPGYLTGETEFKPGETEKDRILQSTRAPLATGILDYQERMESFRQSNEWQKLLSQVK